MNLDQLDDPNQFSPDDAFRSGVRRRGAALRHRRRRRIGAAVATPLLVGATGIAWVGSRLDEVDSIDVAMPGGDLASGDPVDILVVGTDAGLHDGHAGPPNADAIALVRFDTAGGAVRVLPLPRDLRIAGASDESGEPVRLATVLGASGPDGLVAAVEETLTVDGTGPGIDHYVQLDTAALAGLVDAAGGIPVHNAQYGLVDEASGARLEPGCQVLDGDAFVALSRSRRPVDAAGQDLSHGRGDLHRMDVNVALGHGLASVLLAAQPTPDALLTFLGPVVEGMTLDSELSITRLAELGWWARSLPGGPGTATVVSLPTEVVEAPGGQVSLALGDGWEHGVLTWLGDPRAAETETLEGHDDPHVTSGTDLLPGGDEPAPDEVDPETGGPWPHTSGSGRPGGPGTPGPGSVVTDATVPDPDGPPVAVGGLTRVGISDGLPSGITVDPGCR